MMFMPHPISPGRGAMPAAGGAGRLFHPMAGAIMGKGAPSPIVHAIMGTMPPNTGASSAVSMYSGSRFPQYSGKPTPKMLP